MTSAVATGKPRRRRFRRIAAALGCLLLASPFLFNLLLTSQFGRDRIAALIQRRTGLECRIQGISITPWNGIELRGLSLLQPPPLRDSPSAALFDSSVLRLSPVWKSCIRGRLDIQSITLDSPVIVLPVELLADLAKARISQAPANPTPPPPAQVTPAPTPPTPAPPAPVQPAPQTTPPPAQPPAKAPPTAWLHIRNGNFSLTSFAKKTELAAIRGIRSDIPLAGGPASSTSHISKLLIHQRPVLTDLKPQLSWNPPFLTATSRDIEIDGFRISVQGSTALAPGLPLQLEVALPPQALREIQLPGNHRLAAQETAASARFRGFLLAPSSWQGEFVATTKSPSGQLAGNPLAFDRGNCVILLRNGVLSCTDARLIGDELSLLGNSTLIGDGRLAAALRIVAPPANLGAIANRLFPAIAKPSFTELATPQRSAFDLEAFGHISQIFIRPGREGPVLVLKR